jgi:hypothetical protein
MTDAPWVATDLIAQLEAGDGAAVWAQLDEAIQAKVPVEKLDGWDGGVTGWIGKPRRVIDATDADDDPNAVHVLLQGATGSLRVTVRRNDDGRVTGIALTPWVSDGIRNIVIGCPRGVWNEEHERVDGEPRQLGEFYAELIGGRIIRDDWIKVAVDAAAFPHLAFGDGWSDERPVRWDDPDYPQQAHLDVFVPDLDAAESAVVARGASRVRDAGSHRILADPFGHAFCLYPDPGGVTRLARVVFACDDPRPAADFWSELIDMPVRVERSDDRIAIGRANGLLPQLAFQHVDGYVAPRWHDPMFPEQMHLDLSFNVPSEGRARAEALGATPLPPPRGSCPVYADPAGHPFCLCSSSGTEEQLVVDVLAT